MAQDAEPQCVEASLTARRNDNRRFCPSGATPSAASTGTLITRFAIRTFSRTQRPSRESCLEFSAAFKPIYDKEHFTQLNCEHAPDVFYGDSLHAGTFLNLPFQRW